MLQCAQCRAENAEGARFCNQCAAPLVPSPPEPVVATPAELVSPASVANGRYELVRLLGEGGKKLVYLSKDGLLGREVALALIKADGLDAGGRERVLREAQAMGRLGAHPNIVAVFDLGEEQGRPFMVTELMGGGDLEGLLDKAADGRLPVAQAVELGKGICRGLVFAHGQGVIHRDLKPGNVWLTSEGQPKIGDFGLALASERSRLTQEGTMVGTASYMPPEQALGGETTARADLYSLGALLYELLTGRPPFVADDPIAVISQHINTPPVAPSWHIADCPRALEALVLRLLAKDPSERPASAADVLTALEAIELGGTPHPPEADGDGAGLEGLAAGVFVGRRHELGALKAALEGVLSGEGRLVTVVGEPGIGKTRVALELATYARLRGAQVLWGRCYESEGAPAYWPWVQALRDYVREKPPPQLQAELGGGAAVISEIVPGIRERLPGMPEPAGFDDPQQARFRLFDSFTAFLKSAARAQPLVIVLEDLHWADEGSLRLLEFVARELVGARLLLVGTYRDIELNRRHPLSRTLAELTREGLSERILLRGLGREDIGRFVEATCRVSPPAELVSLIHTQTEGNPLFVTEIVRLLVQEGELTPERLTRETSWSLRIPEGVREVIGRRLDRLTERCNETLMVASVIGREFSHEQLSALIDDVSEDRLLDVLEEALSARVIEELPRSLGRYQFSHALIRETLTGELSLTRRVRLHARIGDALERLYAGEADRHAAELAYHFAEAQTLLEPAKLVRYSLVAGEEALAAHAHEQALAHFERALAARDDRVMDDETAALLFGLGRAQVAGLAPYEVEPAIANLRRAFEHYVDTGDVSRAITVVAHPLQLSLGLGYTDYAELIAHALRLVSPDSHEAGRLLAPHGWLCGTIDADHVAAHEAFQRALAIAERYDDPALERGTLARAAFVDAFHLRWQDCLAEGLRSIALAQEAGDLHSELFASRPVAWAFTAMGEREHARTHLRSAFALAAKLRERWLLASASYDSALLSLYEGDWHGAREMSELGLATQPRDPRHLALCAILEYGIGNVDAGAPFIARLQEVAGSMPPPGPIADHVFLAATIPLVSRGTSTDAGLDSAAAAATQVLSLAKIAPILAMVARRGLAVIAVERGDADASGRLYRELEPERGTASTFIPLTMDRLLGLLAMTSGSVDAALAHFEEGLTFCDRADYLPERAWTASDYAEALLARGHSGDREQAVVLQDSSLAIAREFGMRPLMQRVLVHRELLKA
jgi:eukaryotic-like serine/threonine-protein kinase